MRPRAAAATAGCARTAASASAGAINLSSISSATRRLSCSLMQSPGREPGMSQLAADLVDACSIVVGHPAAAQNDVAVLVARGVHDGGVTAFGDRQEVVRRGGRLDRIDRDLHAAVGSVLEPDRTRQTR